MNSDKYAYALGVFILSMISDFDTEAMLFDPSVRSIYGKMLAKHEKENRLKNKTYHTGATIGAIAYNTTVDKFRGTDVTINATIRLIQMKHEELLKRVYKIDPIYFISLKERGVQEHTMASVKIANEFLKILDEIYDQHTAKRRAA